MSSSEEDYTSDSESISSSTFSSSSSSDPNCCIYVGQLPPFINESHLRQHFSGCHIISCFVVRDKETKISKGFGFMRLESEEAVERAVTMYNKSLITGKHLIVVRKKQEKKKEGGKGRGKRGRTKGSTSSSRKGSSSSDRKESSSSDRKGSASSTSGDVIKVWVGNIPPGITEDHLSLIFSRFKGKMVRPIDPIRVGEKNSRYSFLSFGSLEDSNEIISEMDGVVLKDHKIVLRPSKPDPKEKKASARLHQVSNTCTPSVLPPEQGSSTVVHLTNLSSEISSTDLSELVSVDSSNININSRSNTASIVFPSQKAASDAVQKLNGQMFLGSTIRAFIATTGPPPPPPRTSSSTSSTSIATPSCGEDSASVRVSNLPLGTKKEDVRSYFSSFGPIVKCDIARQRNKQATSSSAVVTFKTPSSASSAISFDGYLFLGRPMKVSLMKAASKDASIILVTGLSSVTTGSDVFLCFKSYGQIIGKVNVNETYPRRCTIKYTARESAERAVREMNGTTYKGSVLAVQLREEEEEQEEIDGDIIDDVPSRLEPQRFSEKKVISSEMYELWVDNSSSEIESFELKGGTHQYRKGTLSLSAVSQDDIDLLTKKISLYRERTLECSAVQWNQLVVVDELGVSKMDQLRSPFISIPDLRIIERPPLKLLFVGPETTVDSAYYHFFNEFGKELVVDSSKMEALLEMNEDLCKDILKKYRVRVRGFSTGSTKLTFEGNSSSLPLARSAVETALASIRLIPLSPSLSPPLLRAGLGICEKEGITCSVFVHKGQPMLAFSSEDHRQRGEKIFKRKPYTNFVRLKEDESHSVKSLEGVISSDRVHIELSEDSILLKSFEKEDVQEARKEIEEFIGTAVKEEELSCTQEQKVYIKKKLNSVEIKAKFPNVVVRRDSVCVQGTQVDRAQSSKALLELVPKYYNTVIIQCNRRFYPLIDQHIIQPVGIECIVANDGQGQYRRRGRGGKDKENSGEGTSNELKLFVYGFSSLETSIDVLKSVSPNTVRVPVSPKAKGLVEKMKADIEYDCLCKIIINNHPNVLVHSLGQQESQRAKRLILDGIKKQLVIFKHLPSPPIPALHLKYLIEMYKDRFDEVSQGLELFHLPKKRPFDAIGPDETDSIKVKGTGLQVDAVKDMLDELIGESEFYQKHIFLTITFPPYLLRMWRKRWNSLKAIFKEKFDVLIEYKCPECCDRGSQVQFCIYGFNYEAFELFKIKLDVEHSHPLVVSEIPLPIERVKEVHAALSEHKLDFRDYPVDVYCNEKARKITIRAPDFLKDDMETVQDEIENFLEETSIIKDNMSLIDVPTYLLFTSPEHGYYKQAQSFAKGTRVTLRSYRHGQIVGCTLTGPASRIEILKLQLGTILNSIKPLLGYIHVPVDPLALPSLTPTFCSDINSKLESQFMTVLIKKSGSSPPSSPPQKQQFGGTWHWRDSDGSFIPHSASVSKELSSEYKANSFSKYIFIDNGKAIEVDFYSMVQTDLTTGIKRQVSFTSSGSIQWYWTSDDGTKLTPYSAKDSDTIENTYKMKQTVFTMTINQQPYLIDTLAMIQKNMKTGRSRKIERKAPASGSGPKQSSTVRLYGLKTKLDAASQHVQDRLSQCLKTNELTNPLLSNPKFYAEVQKIASRHNVQTIRGNLSPSNDRRGLPAAKAVAPVVAGGGGGGGIGSLLFKGVGFCINKVIQEVQERIIDSKAAAAVTASSDVPADAPPEWESQETNLKLFSVASLSPEYKRIETLFKKTLRNSRIITITRIQNMWLHEKYIQHRDRLALKNKGKINERELFHGTRGTDPKEIYDSEEGFDMRFSASGMWGQANYFASDASYSHLYAHKHPSGYNEIFLVKLLAGESYESEPDSTLRMPPKVTKPKGELQTRYDTVTGTTRGTKVFMAYDNQKAYPAYLIVYAA